MDIPNVHLTPKKVEEKRVVSYNNTRTCKACKKQYKHTHNNKLRACKHFVGSASESPDKSYKCTRLSRSK